MQNHNLELSIEQIDYLFDFVASKNAKYLDVSFEIVDHLASAIEVKMRENSELSFEKALDEVYSTFPITGFARLIEGKTQALRKFWQRKFFQSFKTFFRIPMILFTVLVYGILVLLFSNVPVNGFYIMLPFSIIALVFYLTLVVRKIRSKKRNKPEYLVIEMFQIQAGGLSNLLIAPIWFLDNNWPIESMLSVQLFSILLTLIILILILILYSFPIILKNELKEKYSHLNIEETYYFS